MTAIEDRDERRPARPIQAIPRGLREKEECAWPIVPREWSSAQKKSRSEGRRTRKPAMAGRTANGSVSILHGRKWLGAGSLACGSARLETHH